MAEELYNSRHCEFFSNRECEYFPCHGTDDPDNFNCLFCYCPLYHLRNCPGNPCYIEKGKSQLKVCTECTFPHQPENYDVIVKILKEQI